MTSSTARKSELTSTGRPQQWWQWLLLYPALGLSVISAVPQWADKALAIIHDAKSDSYQEALRENKLWHENVACAGAPYAWYTSPKEIKVDATICNSGDVFVRATTPSGKVVTKWLALTDVIGSKPQSVSLVPEAHAQSLFRQDSPMNRRHFTLAQYQNVFVVCQRFIDQRMLLRHVNSGGACFDEVIDTFNGALVRRTQVPCRPSC